MEGSGFQELPEGGLHGPCHTCSHLDVQLRIELLVFSSTCLLSLVMGLKHSHESLPAWSREGYSRVWPSERSPQGVSVWVGVFLYGPQLPENSCALSFGVHRAGHRRGWSSISISGVSAAPKNIILKVKLVGLERRLRALGAL